MSCQEYVKPKRDEGDNNYIFNFKRSNNYYNAIKSQNAECNYVYNIYEKVNYPIDRTVDCCKNIVGCTNGRVTSLKVNSVRLTSFPEEIFQLKNLEIFFSGINSIPEQISQLSQLKELLVIIVLSSLPSSITKLNDLDILEVDSNNLRSISEEILKLPHLKLLSVSSNKDLKIRFLNHGHTITNCYVDLNNLLCYDAGACSVIITTNGGINGNSYINNVNPCSNNNYNSITTLSSNNIPLSTTINEQNPLISSTLLPTLINSNPNPSDNNDNNIYTNNINSTHNPDDSNNTKDITIYVIQKYKSTDCNIYYDYLEKNGSQEPYNRNEDCCTLKNIKCNNGRIIYLYNNVNFISDDIYKLTALETLDISDSNASYLSEQILNLSNLRELNLSRNKISSLPSNFGKLTNLDILILNNNNFATLPSEIFKLPRLNFFSASGNKNLKLKLYNFGHAINYCFVDLESISCYDPGACIIRIKDINQSRTERESAAIMEQFPSCSNVIGVTNTQPFPTTINGQSTLTISPLSPTVINNDPNNPNNSNNSNIPTDDYINSLFDPNSKIFTDNNMQRYFHI
ncbi:L domain-like protein [Anaeromyces robustus]|uniref:L domain-like protein n=1 Tax=Anaeromyces robustus TaxID=1754192 RepID=A0A1Y1XK91_9FUNG|nr:L domain-like protein [Anaeromyces robustus]|eukprot:ORX86113.1 L domain-like protein [Anaeromyces robustus]